MSSHGKTYVPEIRVIFGMYKCVCILVPVNHVLLIRSIFGDKFLQLRTGKSGVLKPFYDGSVAFWSFWLSALCKSYPFYWKCFHFNPNVPCLGFCTRFKATVPLYGDCTLILRLYPRLREIVTLNMKRTPLSVFRHYPNVYLTIQTYSISFNRIVP